MSELTQEPEEMTEDKAKEQLYQGLKEQFGDLAPTEETVATWKASSGRVRFVYLADDEVYFIRPAKRTEYKSIIETAQTAGGKDQEGFLRERLVSACVLWPKLTPADITSSYAGTVETLYAAIMEASNFISQEALYTVVRDL